VEALVEAPAEAGVEAAAALAADMDAEALSPGAPGAPRLALVRRAAPTIGFGLLAAFLVFAFLAWLQPVLKGSERLELSSMIHFDLNLKAPKTAPPPEEKPPAEEEEPPPEARPRQERARSTRVERQPQELRTLDGAPDLAAELGNVSVLGAGTGGPGAVQLKVAQTAAAFAKEAMEFVKYQERRERIREGFDTSSRATDRAPIKASRFVIKQQRRPRYPDQARKLGLGGHVKISVLISVEGKVEKWEILAAQPEGVFEDSLIEVLPSWQFPPVLDDDGRPIERWEEFTYVFRLTDA
jgi:protein TonB